MRWLWLVLAAGCAVGAPVQGPVDADAATICAPYPADGACMNADNHAQCLQAAASCGREMRVQESCPLQFVCT